MRHRLTPDLTDVAHVLLTGDRIVAPADHGIDPAHPRAEPLRRLLEALPWITIIARDRWIALLLELTTRHLELCVNGAVLIDPNASHRLPRRPLPYPTVILTDAHAAVAGHARVWSSQILRRDPALSEAQNLRLALRMLQMTPCHA
ncbi:hypothetical protein [Paracoccus laeviglucosivorans]|uniref:Uncharacterized protein n=1 Tax=Paracoccus laeviglucosivorans TaxID=1197861 RepID=A0A521EU24_9RHOB|nr:hypothetical protein [Paracoccus laeviglucosivorans]SMO86921.1 hypothetical protein SAMN06265221_11544 [Paracoccus laeviglucosivorans]